MRQWALDAGKLTTDGVAYTAAASGSLTQAANRYFVLCGANVGKYRINELIDAIDYLASIIARDMDTTRFPRQSGAGVRGSFIKVKLIRTAIGPKKVHTLVTSTDMTTHPLSDDDAIYLGMTSSASPPTVNYTFKMGVQGIMSAVDKIKNYILQSRPDASTVSSVAMTPTTSTKAAGATQQLKLVATYADGSTADVTDADVKWSSSDTTKGTVDYKGLVTAVATGSATITGAYRGSSATCALTVS